MVLQVARKVVEVKILRVPYQVLVVIFKTLTEAVGPYPFTRTSLRGSLVHSNFDLNSTICTIIKIKT